MKKSKNAFSDRYANLKEAQKEQLREKGFSELLNLQIGETPITVDTSVPPREVNTKYGMRDVIKVSHKGQDYDLMINPSTAFYLELLERLTNGETDFVIVRSGTGRSTRYSLK